MEVTPRQIIEAALAAATPEDADQLHDMIARHFGAEHLRPVGDKYNNYGLMGTSGSPDLKLIENVTNMQDSVIEKLALRRYGSRDAVPYRSPHEAARDLTSGISPRDLAKHVQVTLRKSDPSAKKNTHLTPVFRDEGCGMTPGAVPKTIFGLGGSHKENAYFLQGAFGLGGAMTYRNAQAVVLVTRRDPALLDAQRGERDLITVAVVRWQDQTKAKTAFYLVDRTWSTAGDEAEPWSCPAEEFPEFQPGTHLALISFRVEGLQRARGGDEKSFDTILNTRLYEPVLPVRFVNEIARADRGDNLRGLAQRLENSTHDFTSGEEILPFHHEGTTYQLPVRYVLFEKPGSAGERRKFVARDHAVLFTSNGQVHHNWTPRDVRERTGLNKLYDRLLVVVETDELPIQVRTTLFTADRSELVRGDAAIRLEEHVQTFIRESSVLREANNTLIRESYTARTNRSTAEVARRISRALPLAIKGFSSGSAGQGTGGNGGNGSGRAGGGGGRSQPIDLHPDPTSIAGPKHVKALIGQLRSITYTIDVADAFYDGRGELRAYCDHPEIEERAVAVGRGRDGRARVTIAVPDTARLGVYRLEIVLEDWMRVAGGIGPRLAHVTSLEVVEEIEGSGSGNGKPTKSGEGKGGPTRGGGVALRWTDKEEQEGWLRSTVGAVEDVPAQVLAEKQSEYADLAALGDQLIPTVLLNQDYPPFKNYIASRNKELTDVERPMEQYAVGVGVSMMLLHQSVEDRAAKGGSSPDDAFLASAYVAAATGVLAVMPAFDELAKEAGLTG